MKEYYKPLTTICSQSFHYNKWKMQKAEGVKHEIELTADECGGIPFQQHTERTIPHASTQLSDEMVAVYKEFTYTLNNIKML